MLFYSFNVSNKIEDWNIGIKTFYKTNLLFYQFIFTILAERKFNSKFYPFINWAKYCYWSEVIIIWNVRKAFIKWDDSKLSKVRN